MSRRLSAHERALWQRVAGTVRPLHAGTAPPPPAPEPAKPEPARPLRAVPSAPPKRPIRPVRQPVPVLAATLDGSWDRKLRQGRLVPDRVIDLHGHDLARAHAVLRAAVVQAADEGARVLLVITGKGRAERPGRIRAELADWLQAPDQRDRIAALRPASPRHGGPGAFYLVLRRAR
jgi:DNA-nicking Smr family endonuclease